MKRRQDANMAPMFNNHITLHCTGDLLNAWTSHTTTLLYCPREYTTSPPQLGIPKGRLTSNVVYKYLRHAKEFYVVSTTAALVATADSCKNTECGQQLQKRTIGSTCINSNMYLAITSYVSCFSESEFIKIYLFTSRGVMIYHNISWILYVGQYPWYIMVYWPTLSYCCALQSETYEARRRTAASCIEWSTV